MFDIGWTELMVIGVVALIVIGPKDLPAMFQQLGRFTAKMRAMARDFQRAMDQAANESGLNDVARDLKSATSIKSTGINAMKDAASKFEKWDPIKNAARPTVTPAAAAATSAVVTKAPPGPETQAMLDAQSKRQAIIAETTERLRAVSKPATAVATETAAVTPPPEPVKAPRKSRAKPPAADAAEPVAAPAKAAPAKAAPAKAAPAKPRKPVAKSPSKATTKADQA